MGFVIVVIGKLLLAMCIVKKQCTFEPVLLTLIHSTQRQLLRCTEPHHRYDRVLNLKQAAKLRDLALSSEQRAAKEDLERRENAAKRGRTDEVDAKRRLEAEVARLRTQGLERLERERERLLREAEAEEAAARAARERNEGEQVCCVHMGARLLERIALHLGFTRFFA